MEDRFRLRKALSDLRKRLLEVSKEHNENAIFTAKHQEAFEQFRVEYPQTWNVFIGINYDQGYEVTYIRDLLRELERAHKSELKFHSADEYQHRNREIPSPCTITCVL